MLSSVSSGSDVRFAAPAVSFVRAIDFFTYLYIVFLSGRRCGASFDNRLL